MTEAKDADNISEDERDGHVGIDWEEELKGKKKERKEGRKEERGREGKKRIIKIKINKSQAERLRNEVPNCLRRQT